MPSLRQRMTTYLRQLSFIADPSTREESRIVASLSPRNRPDDGCFITRYLEGRMNKALTTDTEINHGKEPVDLPELKLLWYDTGTATITAACTGPDEGLTGVKRSRLHLSAGPDIDFIDTIDHEPEPHPVAFKTKSFKLRADQNANKPFARAQRKLSSSTPPTNNSKGKAESSNTDPTTKAEPKIEKATINVVVSLISASGSSGTLPVKPTSTSQSLTLGTLQQHTAADTLNRNTESKSKTDQPTEIENELANDNVSLSDSGMELPAVIAGVSNWKLENDHAYGLSMSLYEKNYVTNEQVGNPVADCYGLVVRGNTAVMALADGVNWGEGARLAARSAVQGCLEYLDTAIFGQVPAGMASTTREVFVSLLRSFWEAHACILEVGGALSTLTAAVVLPLGDPYTDKHIVCACNVGDSLGYVYSKRHGVREFTQYSHDIQSMRDMRDALGALGPVDGNKPELGNLTLSMTIVEAGDIVFLTSDGISDNFDPVVGKFAEAFTDAALATAQSQNTPHSQPDVIVVPQLAPKRQNKSASAIVTTNVGRSESSKMSQRFSLQPSGQSKNSKQKTNTPADTAKPPVRPQRASSKKSSSSSTSTINSNIVASSGAVIATSTAVAAPTSSRPKFLRSHTVIEPRATITASAPSIQKFPKSLTGLPLVTGPQRHKLTLLRLEDLLCFGINGTLRPCPSARKLCHLLIDFARMITSARRNILEQRELYYRFTTDHTGQRREVELNKLQQRVARKRVVDGSTFATLPGKLDHASVCAYTVGSALKPRSNLTRISVFSETDF